MEQIFTSTGMKLLHHPDVVYNMKKYRKCNPISLQVAPTSICNLNCSFCSNAKRTKHESLNVFELMDFLDNGYRLGARTVEWTGGGDPTMYEHINYIINTAEFMGYEQGMITNGILLKDKINEGNLRALKWIRVSMNCLDYVDHIDIPEFDGVLGFSYVMNGDSVDIFKRIDEYVNKYKPAYVRVVPNCLATDEEQEENNKKYSRMINDMGKPYFYQAKHFNTPEHCWWGYCKPFLLHDGYVYPCSSVVLNSGADGKFHEKFRWSFMNTFFDRYKNKMISFPTKNCDHCVFETQNKMIDGLLNSTGMEMFV